MIDRRTLGVLLGLRYRLLLATVRSRSGKLTLFMVGYLLAILLAALLMAGGVGAAKAAVRAGRAELVLDIVLGSVFLWALAAAVFLGIGTTPTFSDTALRRYPLRRSDRFLVRHLTALLEPIWLLVLSIDVGLAIGCVAFGVGRLFYALPAAILLVGCHYLLAQAILTLVDRVLRTRHGRTVVVIVLLVGAGLAPAVPMAASAQTASLLSVLTVAARVTPPLLSTVAFTRSTMVAGAFLLAVAAWGMGLAAVLAALERWQPVARRPEGAPADWDTPLDRLATLFGPALAPLAGKMLRYCWRSPQVRISAPFALPALAMALVPVLRREPTFMLPLAAAGLMVIAGFATPPQTLNLFGFDGAGFRRYFLLPVSVGRVLAVASLVAMLPGTCVSAAGLLLWLVYAPAHTDWRSMMILVSASLTGLCLFATVGIWTSVLAPTAIEFDRVWGNKLSLPANAVLVLTIVGFCSLPLLCRVLPFDGAAFRERWWAGPPLAVAMAGVFAATTRLAGRVVVARRERILGALDPS